MIVDGEGNALARIGSEFQALVPVRGSMAATLQAALPRSRVVAAFQHLPARELGDLDAELVADVLVCADDKARRRRGDRDPRLSAMPGLRAVQCGLARTTARERRRGAHRTVLLNVNFGYRSATSRSASSGLRLEGRRR